MAYLIVNAFLDNMTFESTEAESLIKRVIFETGEVIQEEKFSTSMKYSDRFSSTIQTVSLTERGRNPAIPASISASGET